jgi:glycosidase
MNHLGTHDTIRLLTNFVASNGESLTKEEQANYRMNESEMKNAIVKLKIATAMQFTLPGVPSIYYGDETGMEGFRDPFCRRTIDWEHINEEIFSWYQKLGQIRTHSVYISGVYSEESTGNNVFAFSRENNEEKIMTIINNNNHEIHYHLNSGFDLLQEERVFKKVIIPKKSVKFIQIK